MKEIWTIELNLDDDYANACAYHIDEINRTIETNLKAAEKGMKSPGWVVVGFAKSHEEAHKVCQTIRQYLCEKGSRQPYGIEEIADDIENDFLDAFEKAIKKM